MTDAAAFAVVAVKAIDDVHTEGALCGPAGFGHFLTAGHTAHVLYVFVRWMIDACHRYWRRPSFWKIFDLLLRRL